MYFPFDIRIIFIKIEDLVIEQEIILSDFHICDNNIDCLILFCLIKSIFLFCFCRSIENKIE
jgi:hypothetical protein